MTFPPGATRRFLATTPEEIIKDQRLRWAGFHRGAAAHPRKIDNLHRRITYLEFLVLTPWYIRLWNRAKTFFTMTVPNPSGHSSTQ